MAMVVAMALVVVLVKVPSQMAHLRQVLLKVKVLRMAHLPLVATESLCKMENCRIIS
jgi:hypothetical protein